MAGTPYHAQRQLGSKLKHKGGRYEKAKNKCNTNYRARSPDDGVTFGTPTWIWSVAVGDALYVRAYNGKSSRWHQAAMRQKAGRIIAAGMTRDVTFEPVQGPINDQIDDAYRSKYSGSPYLSPMIGARARSATVKVIPRG